MKKYFKKYFWRFFRFMQVFKIDILPRHFYSEIPCIKELENSSWWRQPYDFEKLGITKVDNQIANFKNIFDGIVNIDSKKIHQKAMKESGFSGYGQIESAILYYFLKKKCPKKIVQIGCGVTTSIINSALFGLNCEIFCIEPYPTRFLIDLNNQGKIKLIAKQIQNWTDVSEVLGDCDFFFVDSTHTLGPAGEVSRIILEYMPLLKSGCYIHFHDIYFPYDYQSQILDANFFFQHESVLLQAFLSFNDIFKLIFSSSMIFHNDTNVLNDVFVDFFPREFKLGIQVANGHFPSSCYIQKI